MTLYLVSERNNVSHVAWGTSYEFEDIIVRTCQAELVSPARYKFNNRLDLLLQNFTSKLYLKPEYFEFSKGPNVLLLIGMGPKTLRMLDVLGDWRKNCDIVAAYIIDLYPGALQRLDKRIVNQLDHLFISYQQMIEPVREHFDIPVSFIPQATDVLTHGSCEDLRPIDVVGYGRQLKDVHNNLIHSFNIPQSNLFYFHSTFKYPDVNNWKDDRLLFWQTMRRSKISLAYCFIETSANDSFGVSPLTARWFESIAAGCCIVGRRPKGPEVDDLLDWDNSTIELPASTSHSADFIKELIDDRVLMRKISSQNYLGALKKHDWRYRLREMFQRLGIEAPALLTEEINLLNESYNTHIK